VGLDPTPCCEDRILSPARLPSPWYWKQVAVVINACESKARTSPHFESAVCHPRSNGPSPWRTHVRRDLMMRRYMTLTITTRRIGSQNEYQYSLQIIRQNMSLHFSADLGCTDWEIRIYDARAAPPAQTWANGPGCTTSGAGRRFVLLRQVHRAPHERVDDQSCSSRSLAAVVSGPMEFHRPTPCSR
jgi:hypothetical protein